MIYDFLLVRHCKYSSLATPFGVGKLEWSGYLTVKKTLMICLAVSTEYRRIFNVLCVTLVQVIQTHQNWYKIGTDLKLI